MKHTDLPYVGRLRTPDGMTPFWDTGQRLSPVELAEILGLQTAVFSARNHQARQLAHKKTWDYVEALSQRLRIFAPSARVTCSDDGRVFVSYPEYDDERPAVLEGKG